jgi:Fe-S oxidoreductase
MQPGDVMVAPGTSCRQQMKDLGGKIALHPAELVRSLLK